MHRKEFIKTCGFACLSMTVFAPLLTSCLSSKSLTIAAENGYLIIPANSFQKEDTKYYSHIFVQNESLKYPICIFRYKDNDYKALLMRCTHQGAELQLFGSRFECPAHGSEFDNKGNLLNGPAESNLKSFEIIIENQQLKIKI